MRVFIVSVIIVLHLSSCSKSPSESFIAVDLVGYNVDNSKLAFLVNVAADSFEVLDAGNLRTVFKSVIKKNDTFDLSSGDSVQTVDFSAITTEGSYYIQTEGPDSIRSLSFDIGSDVYKNTTLTALQSFYYNRCGTEVNNGEPWSHPACHMDDAVFYRDTTRQQDVTGGWHDAGDYGKFSINTELSVALMLSLYEDKQDQFFDGQLRIPENNNGIPDLLDEASWALEWLLKMQNKTGGIYHKVSQKKWIGEFLPQNDPGKRYIFRVSSNATAGFAAVASQGARLLQSYNTELSDRLAKAAVLAWGYLLRHPVTQPLGGFKNPPGVLGGEYGDYNDDDERLWAAIELYKLKQDKEYLSYFIKNYSSLNMLDFPPLSWRNFNSLAFGSFLNTPLPDRYQLDKKNVVNQLVSNARGILKEHQQNQYLNLLNHTEYYWGSNSVDLGYAFDLIQAYKVTHNESYKEAALDQLHYVLGRNSSNLSYVTGAGSRPVKHPYHQFSMRLNVSDPVPGMMVGGPNNTSHIGWWEISEYPAKNYEDVAKNYLVNEVAINYTAIFLYVSGYFSFPTTTTLSFKPE